MAVSSRAVSVATTATRLDTSTETGGQRGSSIAIYNNGSATIYLGGSTVTTATGTPVAAGTWGPGIELEGGAGDVQHEGLYGIVASGTVEARVLESGV